MVHMRILLLAIATLSAAFSQTNPIRCPFGTAGQISVLVMAPPPNFVVCMVLEPGKWTVDKTTSPFTLRILATTAPAPPPPQPTPVNETPAGAVDGSNPNFTLSSPPTNAGLPILVYKNGLLLTRCITTGCNGDYQQSGTSLLFLSSAQTASGASAVPQPGDLVQVLYWK